MKNKIEKLLIEISIKIARQGKGCLFVIKDKSLEYKHLIEQDIKPFNIFDNQRRLETLAMIDGACIIDLNGNLIAYGVNISNIKVFPGFGTRHSAGYTASLKGNTSILASEEDKKVRIFKDGKLVMQIDPFEKEIDKKTKEVVNILESIGVGTIGTLGVTTLIPTLGLQLISGVIIFGSTHLLMKLMSKQR